MTRVTDNMHYPSDVLAGSIIGLLMAVLSYSRLRLFIYTSNVTDDCSDEEPNNLNIFSSV